MIAYRFSEERREGKGREERRGGRDGAKGEKREHKGGEKRGET